MNQEAQEGSEPLRDARHERFAQELVGGKTQAEAYVNAGFSPTGANGAASRLLAAVSNGLASRVRWLKQQSANAAVLDAEEKRKICAEIARAKTGRQSDRLKAIQVDNDLAEHGAEAAAARAIAVVVRRAWGDG